MEKLFQIPGQWPAPVGGEVVVAEVSGILIPQEVRSFSGRSKSLRL
jgi:hypothetical protein